MKLNIIFIMLLLVSCKSIVEKQEEYLLPLENRIQKDSTFKKGISEFSTFSVIGEVDAALLSDYPIKVAEDIQLIKWHRPKEIELMNLRRVYEYAEIDSMLMDSLNRWGKDNVLMVTYILNEDKILLNSNDYDVTNWIDIFFLNIERKKLIYVGYGEF
jgi:hypothetical protein